MSSYELMVIYNPNLKDTEVQSEIKNLKDKVKDYEGQVIKENFWGLKDMAYQIGKFNKGYYHVLEFSVGPGKVNDLSKWLSNQEKSVVRKLIVRLD